MDRFSGSFEIVDTLTDASRSSLGSAIDATQAELVLAAMEGLTDFTAVEPEAVGSTVPIKQWTATDAAGRLVRVMLWQERPFTATEIGRAMAAAIVEEERRGRG